MAKKILIIDDDRYIRELYEEVLKNEGFEVTTALDGEAGLDLILKNSFDLILLDVMMPKLDGLGVLAQLRNNPKKPATPIVLLTNLANDPNIAEVIKNSQAKSYLIKSDFTPDEFLNKVKTFLQ